MKNSKLFITLLLSLGMTLGVIGQTEDAKSAKSAKDVKDAKSAKDVKDAKSAKEAPAKK